MFLQLLLLFVLVPLADLVVLFIVTDLTSVWVAVGLVVVSGAVGVWLARRQWRWIGREAQLRLSRNELPSELASDAIIVLLAAGLFITPGILTDLLGITLLVPACRGWYKSQILQWLRRKFRVKVFQRTEMTWDEPDEVIDGEFRPVEPAETDQAPFKRLPR